MEPFSAHLAVVAQSAQVVSNDLKSILVEAGLHTPLKWFLEQTQPPPIARNGGTRSHARVSARKHKRRKVEKQSEGENAPALFAEQNEHKIVLGQVTLDISLPIDSPQADLIRPAATTVPLRLLGVLQDRHNLELQLGRAWDDSVVLKLHTDMVEQAHLQALEACITPATVLHAYGRVDLLDRPMGSSFSCVLKESQPGGSSTLSLEISVSWLDDVYGHSSVDSRVLATFFPGIAPRPGIERTTWNPRDFYGSVYTPPRDISMDSLPKIGAQLYPFQKRTVQWMLGREGVSITSNGEVVSDVVIRTPFRLHHEARDVAGNTIFYNPVSCVITSTVPADEAICSGGILAEEMGLGKTVEIVALVTAHQRRALISNDPKLAASKATLIISPATILQQWKTELNEHAPALRVYHYEGMAASSNGRRSSSAYTDLVRIMTQEHDIVITTYQTLTREIHFATEPPKREMRHSRKYERPKCPLVEIEWWRICLDEAQMLETGVSNAARVACQLPRVHSWAVSGTPVKRNVEDLHGLMVFLRMEPFASNDRLWQALMQRHPETARRLFRDIALRHTKAQVRGDIQLPAQKRIVLNMPFTTVENQHYINLFNEMCTALSLNTDGSPATMDWNPDDGGMVMLMRTWLARLRRTCNHPQMAGRGGRRIGRHTGPLRTVDEVLELMIEQNEVLCRTEERAALQAQLTSGHVLGNNGQDEQRSMKALEVYEAASARSQEMVDTSRQRLKAAQSSLAIKQEAGTSDGESSDEADTTLGRYRANLRSALQLLHTSIYFAASAKYQIKVNEELTPADSDAYKHLDEEESALYEQAKAVRREILQDAHLKAEKAMNKIGTLRDTNKLAVPPTFKDLDRLGGIVSRSIIAKSYDLFDTIRTIGATLVKWRLKMIELLTMQLVDEEVSDKELQGDEYEQSTKHQDELYVYFDAYKALQADLNRCISGENAPLIDAEAKSTLRAAKRWLDPEVMADLKGQVHAPELTVQLFDFRLKIRNKLDELDSIRGLIADARRLQDQPSLKLSAEATLAGSIVGHLQPILNGYTKAQSSFEKEVDQFRTTQNLRLEFYRQLQAISDDVAPYKEKLDEALDSTALGEALAGEARHSGIVSGLRTKHRFLMHLQEETGKDDTARICVICQTTFDNGVLTVCGHQYCKECIQEWWRQHRSCPVCKRRLALVDFHNITYKPQELKAQEEDQLGRPSPDGSMASNTNDSRHASIYSEVDSKLMEQIKSYDLPRSYGTKIDTLARHLLWIREHDPGAKSVVFSQYREFLDVLSTAFKDFKIGHVRLGMPQAVERFRKEASKDCLLLDAKTDSSGLTLVNATHVFICEPLVQTAVELQAIARVHRIGQTRPTTVWMYLVNDTVEESIYAISKARRLAHMQTKAAMNSNQESGASTPLAVADQAIDKANSEELQSAQLHKLFESGKNGGEAVDKHDLWGCLFGNSQKMVAANQLQVQADLDRNLRAHAAERRAKVLST